MMVCTLGYLYILHLLFFFLFPYIWNWKALLPFFFISFFLKILLPPFPPLPSLLSYETTSSSHPLEPHRSQGLRELVLRPSVSKRTIFSNLSSLEYPNLDVKCCYRSGKWPDAGPVDIWHPLSEVNGAARLTLSAGFSGLSQAGRFRREDSDVAAGFDLHIASYWERGKVLIMPPNLFIFFERESFKVRDSQSPILHIQLNFNKKSRIWEDMKRNT